MDILIIGGGIGGHTLALAMHASNPDCHIRLYEAAPEIRPIGVGINMLPHAVRALSDLGLRQALEQVAVTPKEFVYFTHNGQFVFSEPCGLHAGYPYPHFSIHRGDLLMVLHQAVRERIGGGNIFTDHRCVRVEQNDAQATAHFTDRRGAALAPVTADLIIACDGIHSTIRKQFYPDEGTPVFHGINMWRGVTIAKPFLTGGSIARIGGLHTTNKLLFYPIRNDVDADGRQLINWVAEVVTDRKEVVDWSAPGKLEDFFHLFEGWTIPGIEAARMIREAEYILSYPMVDRDPVARWTFGRVTLMGDAAHPMYPRGGNGGAQAILDASSLARHLAANADPLAALRDYERERVPFTRNVVLQSRTAPPDMIIDTVEQRTGGKPFERIEDVISQDELRAMLQNYARVAGYDQNSFQKS